jgi:hypothetical protein
MSHDPALAGSRGLTTILDLERGLDLGDLRGRVSRYAIASGYDRRLRMFKGRIGAALELDNADHQSVLLDWLRQWGCRHLSHASEPTAAAALGTWAQQWVSLLPHPGEPLVSLSSENIIVVAIAYGQLAEMIAGERLLAKGPTNVNFGPTAAAKTMYALRPNACAPWDEQIRDELGFGENDAAYRWYLQLIAQTLCRTADRAGTTVVDLPTLAERPGSSPPKLIDEYLWTRITKGW